MALDQFYTRPDVAERCFETISQLSPDLWIEPSAGTGSFFSLLPEPRFGIDLEPKCEGVIQGNWLDYVPPSRQCVIVGNPPFGYRAQGAIEFFNHGAPYATHIAFIVPRSFRKAYIINQLNPWFHLDQQIVLDLGAFIGGADKIRTVWQVWERRDYKRAKIVLPKTSPHFQIVSQGQGFDPHTADLAIRRTGYKSVGEVVDPLLAKPITQFIFVKGGDRSVFESLDLSCAWDTALAPTFTQGELIQAYHQRVES
jgi:hypothetical protein